jgi:hypothetical protein
MRLFMAPMALREVLIAIFAIQVDNMQMPRSISLYRRHNSSRALHSEDTVAKSLEGDYRPEHIFALRQSLAAYRDYQLLNLMQHSEMLEARVGIEPTHKGFADLSLTAWVPRLVWVVRQ